MKVAVIDLGTNTFHLIIVEVVKDEFKIIYREKIAVKIGENGINQGFITEEACVRALTTLQHFKSVIAEKGATETYSTATSAIRNAKNGKGLVNQIEKVTGISIRIISGLEEAEYIYFGVNKALNIGTDPALIMDIGGGSIEFIIGTSERILWKESFEIGGQRMVERFQKHDPILSEEIKKQKEYLQKNLQPLFEACEKYQPTSLIGSSGTFDTLSDIYRIAHNVDLDQEATEYPLTINAFYEIHELLIHSDKLNRLKIPGMIPLRVDMIVVASVLIDFVLSQLHIRSIRVSAYALKEGVLLGTITALRKESAI